MKKIVGVAIALAVLLFVSCEQATSGTTVDVSGSTEETTDDAGESTEETTDDAGGSTGETTGDDSGSTGGTSDGTSEKDSVWNTTKWVHYMTTSEGNTYLGMSSNNTYDTAGNYMGTETIGYNEDGDITSNSTITALNDSTLKTISESSAYRSTTEGNKYLYYLINGTTTFQFITKVHGEAELTFTTGMSYESTTITYSEDGSVISESNSSSVTNYEITLIEETESTITYKSTGTLSTNGNSWDTFYIYDIQGNPLEQSMYVNGELSSKFIYKEVPNITVDAYRLYYFDTEQYSNGALTATYTSQITITENQGDVFNFVVTTDYGTYSSTTEYYCSKF